MISTRLQTLLFITILVVFSAASPSSLADDTAFSVLLKRSTPDDSEYSSVTARHNGNPADGYTIGPLTMTDNSRYSLQVSPSVERNGITIVLRVVPRDAVSIEDMMTGKVVNGMHLMRTDDGYSYQIVSSDLKNAVGVPVSIKVSEFQQGKTIVHYRTDNSAAFMPDTIAVLNFLMTFEKNREKNPAEDKDELVKAIHKLSLSPPPADMLLIYVNEDRDEGEDNQVGHIRGDDFTILPVHVLDAPLLKMTSLVLVQPPSKLLRRKPPAIFALTPGANRPGLGLLTMPVFIEGPGDTMVPRKGTTVKGCHYFFQILEEDSGITINMRRYDRATVEESVYQPARSEDVFSFHLGDDSRTVTITDGLKNRLNHSSFMRTVPELVSCKTFKEKLQTINYVPLFNMMSRWVKWLHPNDEGHGHVTAVLRDEVHASFDGRHSPVTKLKEGITFDYHPDIRGVNIGFLNSHIHTYMMSHPTNPASGMEIGPVYLTDDKGLQSPYSFVVRSKDHDSFVVSLHALETTMNPKTHTTNQANQILLGARNNALASLHLECVDNNTVGVTILDQYGETAFSTNLHSIDWNIGKDIISPLPLPGSFDTNTRVNLPGLAACINLLSHATSGTLQGSVDLTQLPELLHRQSSMDITHQKGAYYSPVSRDFSTVPHYHQNGVVRWGVYGAKLAASPVSWALRHPRTTTAGLMAAGAAYAYPDQAAQFWDAAVQLYGSAFVSSPHTEPVQPLRNDPGTPVEKTVEGSLPVVDMSENNTTSGKP